MALHPTNELVAVAWLKGLAGLNNLVATELPKDNSTWSASGFTQVMTVGGTPDIYLPLNQPVITVDLWAVSPQSSKPPWNKAAQLAAVIKAGCWDHANVSRALTLPSGYAGARVLTAYPLGEPRKVRSDSADYAHWSMDLQLVWVELP